MRRLSRCSGFTLIEMTVVLAIVGLIVGGVMAGRSLLHSSQLRSINADITMYRGAFTMFQQRYEGLPGDIKTATSYWGTDADGCPTHSNRVKKSATCNGNGDGKLGYGAPAEFYRAFQQLANAGFIAGPFTGITGSLSTNHAIIDDNCPAASRPGTGFAFHNYLGNGYNADGSDTARFAGDYGQATMIFGKNNTDDALYTVALNSADAYEIDAKGDDGMPGTGSIKTFTATRDPYCTSSSTASTSTYLLTTGIPRCNLLITIQE